MRIDEISLDGVCSSEYGLTFGTETHAILPEKRKVVQEIVGRDGVIDYGIGGYGTLIITKPVYFDGDYSFLRKNRMQIASWLSTRNAPKQLKFGYEPDRYYLAKVYAAIDFENTNDRHIGNVQFECNPPWAFLNDGTMLSPEQITWVNCDTALNQFIKEFTADGNIKFVNNGTASVKPVIKIIGKFSSGLTFTHGTEKLKLNLDLCFDGVKIDCENETVERMSNGDNLSQFIDDEYEDFFILSSGNERIDIELGTGDRQQITAIVEFTAKEGID